MLAALLLLLAHAANPAPTPSPEGVSVTVSSGVSLHADLRADYLVGFSTLVTITVRNDGATPAEFPDLKARPWLVRFGLTGPDGKKEDRFTTPPATDPGTKWALPPQSRRVVLLEIPSSSAMGAGSWTIDARVEDAGRTWAFPSQVATYAPAKPVGGTPVWEPAISSAVGAMLPWVQAGKTRFGLYLMQFAPDGRVQAQYHLLSLDKAVEPVLSRARATDARARWIYWQDGERSLRIARLDGTDLRAAPRSIGVPWRNARLLARGATDAKGTLVLPYWVPAPKGSSGSIEFLCIDDRGGVSTRDGAELRAPPAAAETAIDAESNLLLGVGHDGGVDLYRVDSAAPARLPARGRRISALTEGWGAAAIAFDSLPDTEARPGGLAMLTLLTRTVESGGRELRTIWSDLAGKPFVQGPSRAWTAPGTVIGLHPNGYNPWSYLTREEKGALWFGAEAEAPVKLSEATPGVLWPIGRVMHVRAMAAGSVVSDRVAAPVRGGE